jgi:2-polyprenyl-3-methyl-5-hydroxy-6-metoxy-1,4-benzoquinol methylase
MRRRWNHNIHYHPVLLDAMPERRECALDVGCGEGTLACKLRSSFRHVTAIDVDAASIELARAQEPDAGIDYVLADFRAYPFEPASFDFVVCVAALHHMDPPAALRRMAELLRPGGALAVLGLARSRYPRDLPRDLAAAVATRAHKLTKDHWESPSPTIWPPSHDYAEIRAVAAAALPAARFRRHLLWRYSITWIKPELSWSG